MALCSSCLQPIRPKRARKIRVIKNDDPRYVVPIQQGPHQLEWVLNQRRHTCQADPKDPCSQRLQKYLYHCRRCGQYVCAFHSIQHMDTQVGPAVCAEAPSPAPAG